MAPLFICIFHLVLSSCRHKKTISMSFGFNLKHIKGDVFGGITAGVVALPLALAFGVSSGLGPTAGLYGAIFVGFFAALFGGTPTQISGPTAPMTAISMVLITSIIAVNEGDVSKALPIILTVFLLTGLFQIVLGFIGLGQYIKYIPYPVVSGFMTAIGIIILITQILPAIGYYPKEDTDFINQLRPQAKESVLKNILKEEVGDDLLMVKDFEKTILMASTIADSTIEKEASALAGKRASGLIGTIKVLPHAIKNIKWLELWLALGTIFIIYGFKRITKKIPSSLVALIVVSLIASIFGLDYKSIEEIPDAIPQINFSIFTNFSIGNLTPYIFTALTLALLGAIDSLLTSVVADNMTKTRHNPNKELIGQGIGNTVGALFGGIPGAGATIRTVVNINAGGKTKLSGMIASVLLLIVLVSIGPIASKIPAAVLAGILITVGVGVMDYKGLRAIRHLPKDLKIGPIQFSSEVVIMFTVMILSSVWDLIYAVGIGLVMASLMFMKKIGDLTEQKSDVKSLEKEKAWKDEYQFPSTLKKEVFIKHLKGPLFFGSTSNFQVLFSQIPSNANTVILRFSKMTYIDQSGLYAIEDMAIKLAQDKINILIVGLNNQPRYMLERIDIIPDLIPEDHIFENFDGALVWLNANIKHQY